MLKKFSLLFLFLLPVLLWSNPAEGRDGAALLVEPGEYDFGFLGAGSTSAPVIFTIRNASPEPVEIARISNSNQVTFSVNVEGGPNPCGSGSPVLAAGASCSVSVRFQPFATGLINGKLGIGSGRRDTPEAVVSLTGHGIACGC
jgi:hypothetical protein